MKTLITLFALLWALPCFGFPPGFVATVGQVPVVAGGGPAIADDFSGTLSNWTVEASGWAISSGVAALTATDVERHMRHNTSTGGANHYAQATITYVSSVEVGLLLRCDTSQNCDGINYQTATSRLAWWGVTAGNWAADYTSESAPIASGSVLKCAITGTGASTRIYCYDDGVLVDAGSGYTFGGDSGKDTGDYVGIYGTNASGGSSSVDNFSADTY